MFAAAADSWFAVSVRRVLATRLAGVLPVQRGSSGTADRAHAALLAAAGPALAAGRTVVVFPEGTRTDDGTVGRSHSEALRLAQDCGVPVVPVALRSTRELLPKHGRLVSSRAGLLAAFAWGVAEATSWPVTAEMTLVLAAVAVPRRVPVWVVWAVARVLNPWLRRLWGPYLLVVGAGFAVGLALVVSTWRRADGRMER